MFVLCEREKPICFDHLYKHLRLFVLKCQQTVDKPRAQTSHRPTRTNE